DIGLRRAGSDNHANWGAHEVHLAAARDLALFDQAIERCADHDQNVDGFATCDTYWDGILRSSHRRSKRRDHLVPGTCFELRHEFAISRGEAAGYHDLYLGCTHRSNERKDAY